MVPNVVSTSWGNFIGCQCDRTEFKLAVLVYKALNGLSPQYLADDCQLTSTAGRRRLWSSNEATCEVPRTRTSLGDRSFTVAGPRLCNNLHVPLHLYLTLNILEFRRLLKTHLFCWGQRRQWLFDFCAPYKFSFTLHFTLHIMRSRTKFQEFRTICS